MPSLGLSSSSSELVAGANLLRALTEGKRRKHIVTQGQMDSDLAVLVNHHRLCHSPIKVTSEEEDREQLWSPSSSSVQGIGQLLGEDQDGLGTPNLSFRESKIGEVDSFLEASKRSERQAALPMVPRSSKDLEKKAMLDKQRIISPTSSNEKLEDDAATDVENRPLQPKAWESQNTQRQHYAPPPVHHHQVWQHHPHATPAVHAPPRYAQPYGHHGTAHFPPPWAGVYGAPAAPIHYYSQHAGPPSPHHHSGQHHHSGHGGPPHHHGRHGPVPPQQVTSGHLAPHAAAPLATITDPVATAKKLDRFNDLDWQAVHAGASRCIPIKHPTTNRCRLVNFPDFMARGRHCGMEKSGKKSCVMCGNERLSMAARAREDSTHIIPRQNKGVCTLCDVAVWLVLDLDTEIKWCKGCKNFRCWVAFGEKGLATKCVRCRQRQKEKYAEKCRLLS